MKKERWEPYEIQFLCEVAGTMPVHIIAEKLERSPSAIYSKAEYLGVRLTSSKKAQPWTDEELSLITSGKYSNQEIAEKTGRTAKCIYDKRLRLRNKVA